jgi:hypothetical protein
MTTAQDWATAHNGSIHSGPISSTTTTSMSLVCASAQYGTFCAHDHTRLCHLH